MPPKRTHGRPPKAKKQKKPVAAMAAKTTKAKYRMSPAYDNILSLVNRKDPFKPFQVVRLNYGSNYTMTCPATGLADEWTFRTNSIYDPDFTFLGKQPYGRDQIANLYSKYKVMGLEAKITFNDPSADGLFCGVSVTPSTTGATLAHSYGTLIERPWTIVKTISNSGSQERVINLKFDAHKCFGVTKTMYKGDSIYSALMGSNPSTEAYLRLFAGNMNSASPASTINISVEITYITYVYDRITQAIS